MHDPLRSEIVKEMMAAGVKPAGIDALLIFLVIFLVGVGSYQAIASFISAPPQAYINKDPLSFALAVSITFLLGGIFYYFREITKRWWFVYPAIELGISVGLACTAVGQQQNNPLFSIVSLLAAVRVNVDGIKRLVTSWRAAHPATGSRAAH